MLGKKTMLRLLSLCAAALVAVISAAFLAVLPGGPIEPANAYFQQTNIYSSGLIGTHTLALTFDDGPSAYTGPRASSGVLRATALPDVPATLGSGVDRGSLPLGGDRIDSRS